MYAIMQTGGKQYRVCQGDVLYIEKLSAEPGSTVTINEILAVGAEDKFEVGSPFVANASVSAKVIEHGKGKKIIVFKYKAKKNYRRKQGHRQPFTKVVIEKISL